MKKYWYIVTILPDGCFYVYASLTDRGEAVAVLAEIIAHEDGFHRPLLTDHLDTEGGVR